MSQIIQSQTRLQIRESIGYALNDMMLVTCTTTADTDTLKATYSLGKGGDDEYNGRQVICVTPTGSIVAGEKSFISDFAIATYEATVLPAFTATITSGDIFEMWKALTYEEVNDAINQIIMDVTDECLQIKEVHNIYTDDDQYEYNCLSSFVALYKVEYVYSIEESVEIEDCDAVWSELVDTDVTATADTTMEKEGNACLKLVVGALCAATDILATEALSSADISECDQLEIWIYSTVALSAGDLQVLLDNNALCASPVESLDIPATTANTWTRHVISLANPQNDSAIISVGLKMITDKGAFTLYADDIKAVKSTSRVYKDLNPAMWSIVKGTTPYLKLTLNALGLVGNPTQIRLTGYAKPALLSADATSSEIDPAYLVAATTGFLMTSHAKSSRLDIKDRMTLGDRWLLRAERMRPSIRTQIANNVKWV